MLREMGANDGLIIAEGRIGNAHKRPKVVPIPARNGIPVRSALKRKETSVAALILPGWNRLLTGEPALEVGPNRLVRRFCGRKIRPSRALYAPIYSHLTPYCSVRFRRTFQESCQ